MREITNKLDIYLEVGTRRTFAAALDWPGWCRLGRDETTALQSLLDYGERYTQVVRSTNLGFQAPDDLAAFIIVERLQGNAVTDFGAPDIVPTSDPRPLADLELQRLQTVLAACWRGFDAAVEAARGKELRSGPRGGGRSLDGIIQHVLGGEESYLSRLGGKAILGEDTSLVAETLRQAILATLPESAHGEIAPFGPRGGKRWPPRYFVRRAAWHVLDHLWEIEDRLVKEDGT